MIKININWKRLQTVKESYSSNILYIRNKEDIKRIFQKKNDQQNNYEQPIKNKLL